MIATTQLSVPKKQLGMVGLPFIIGLLAIAMLGQGLIAAVILVVFVGVLCISLSSNSKNSRILLLANAVVKIGYCFFDYFFQNSSVIRQDAGRFVRNAEYYAGLDTSFLSWQGELSGSFYDLFMSRIFRLFGIHPLIVQITTISAFLIFLALAFNICLKIGISERDGAIALFLFSFLGSMSQFVMSGIREAWLLMFLAGFILASMPIIVKRDFSFKNSFWLGFCSLCLLVFHKAFNLITPLLLLQIPFLIILDDIRNNRSSSRSIFWIIITVAGLLFILQTPQLQVNVLQKALEGEALNVVNETRNRSIDQQALTTRAQYGSRVNTSSLPAFIGSFPSVYTLYMITPLPWQIFTLRDLYGFIDTWLGLILILFSIPILWQMKGDQRKMVFYLLFSFLIISAVHAMGTINYGTAIRHRLMSHWITYIVGWYGFSEIRNSRRFVRQRVKTPASTSLAKG